MDDMVPNHDLMRITGGMWRGRRLPELKGFDGRPTTDFGREGLFNLLSSRVDLDGVSVLDLFAGTGMVSFEFLSRGAASVTAVERSPKACRYMSTQSRALGRDDLHPVCADVVGFLQRPLTQFDVVFADPPYDWPQLTNLPEMVRTAGVVVPGGWFILEHGERTCVDALPGFVLRRNYGHVHLSLFIFD
jgi:16S rRNA (guanine966-N2)-methyltransferase